MQIDAPAQPLFSIRNESLRYRSQTVLDGISLDIFAGETVALVGKSGAGKSTLLKALRRQQPRLASWCPQEAGLVPSLSVFHNVYMGALERHNVFYNLLMLLKPTANQVSEIVALLDQLQLTEKLWTAAGELSGGQQQRVSIGRSLFQQRSIFLGDEPVSSVDGFQAEHLLALLGHRHSTLVLALHDTAQALATCERIIGLKDGRIALDQASAELSPADLAGLYE